MMKIIKYFKKLYLLFIANINKKNIIEYYVKESI